MTDEGELQSRSRRGTELASAMSGVWRWLAARGTVRGSRGAGVTLCLAACDSARRLILLLLSSAPILNL